MFKIRVVEYDKDGSIVEESNYKTDEYVLGLVGKSIEVYSDKVNLDVSGNYRRGLFIRATARDLSLYRIISRLIDSIV